MVADTVQKTLSYQKRKLEHINSEMKWLASEKKILMKNIKQLEIWSSYGNNNK